MARVPERSRSERIAFARKLRKEMTRAEKMLWWELRRFPVEGSHWRRQAPVGPYVADFFCHGAKLIVEVDGAIHDRGVFAARDAERQAWLEGRGYRVLRFTNDEVFSHVGAVLRAIKAAVDKPSPRLRGGAGAAKQRPGWGA